VLLNVMYDVPSRDDIAQVIITARSSETSVLPTLVPREKLAKRERREKSA
jgi:ATP-dependent Clp protease ATP-binding subunit ClpX